MLVLILSRVHKTRSHYLMSNLQVIKTQIKITTQKLIIFNYQKVKQRNSHNSIKKDIHKHHLQVILMDNSIETQQKECFQAKLKSLIQINNQNKNLLSFNLNSTKPLLNNNKSRARHQMLSKTIIKHNHLQLIKKGKNNNKARLNR